VQISMKFSESSPNNAGKDLTIPRNLTESAAFKKLESLIGLEEVKKTLAELTAFSLVQKKREAQNLKTGPIVMHMVFKGNPGTGKTTVARLLSQVLHELDILSKGHLLEVERADLVGEYIGHTAQKTREMIKQSLGGIMFVDEAYTLSQGGEKDFGREAIATIVKGMEDQRNNLLVILAGYSSEMNRFIASNPGLKSRFPIHIEFPDYNEEELFRIALQMYEERDYQLSNRCRWKLKQQLAEFARSRHPYSGNARYVRNLVEKSIRWQALRIVDKENYTRKDLILIEDMDLPGMDQV
jgi:stage V sporulation protein K